MINWLVEFAPQMEMSDQRGKMINWLVERTKGVKFNVEYSTRQLVNWLVEITI